jgi:hypothetical protein
MAAKKKTDQHKFDVKSYPYTICREQHVWEPYDGVIDNKAKLGYRIQKCAHCPTKRHTIISLRIGDYGDTLSSSYRYPQGLPHRGAASPPPSAVRFERTTSWVS